MGGAEELRSKMRVPHKKPLDPDPIERSEYFVVGTSLPTDAFSPEQVSFTGSDGRWSLRSNI